MQHYAWGGKNYIASLIGLNSAKDQPCAEWWLGAHPSAPSEIENVTGKQSLIEFLLQIRPHLDRRAVSNLVMNCLIY